MRLSLRRPGLLGLGVVSGTIALAFLALAIYAATLGAGPAPAASPATGDGAVHMRGEWTIEVRNPDGTLVTRRDFENGYIGANLLAMILAGDRAPGAWAILLQNGPDPSKTNCRNVGLDVTDALCITEPDWQFSGSVVHKTLAVTADNGSLPVGNPDRNKLKLSGTAVASADLAVVDVFTLLLSCAASVAPNACDPQSDVAGLPLFVTYGTTAPVSLAAGQQLSVVIRFSFS